VAVPAALHCASGPKEVQRLRLKAPHSSGQHPHQAPLAQLLRHRLHVPLAGSRRGGLGRRRHSSRSRRGAADRRRVHLGCAMGRDVQRSQWWLMGGYRWQVLDWTV